jgi:hypothetical protein
MLDKKTLDQISRGIRAAERVRNAYRTSPHRGSSSSELSVSRDKSVLLSEVLNALGDFYPNNAKNRLSASLELSSRFLQNYRNIKIYAGSILKQLD